MKIHPAFPLAIAIGLFASPAVADMATTCGPLRPCAIGYVCSNGLCLRSPTPGGNAIPAEVDTAPTVPAAPMALCTSDAQCPIGYHCVLGHCVLKSTPGDPLSGATSSTP